VTIPNYEIMGEVTRAKAGFEIIFQVPFVTREEEPACRNYSVANQWWLQQSQAIALSSTEGVCVFSLHAYATSEFESRSSWRPPFSL
jgi:hypothetical protein